MSSAPRRANLIEVARAFAWTAGLFLILAAVALPLAHEHLYVAEFKKDLATTVDAMVKRQEGELIRRERLLPELAAGAAASDPRIDTDARVGKDGLLALRAMTAPTAVTTSWLPALIYERRMDGSGSVSEGQWLTTN